MFVSNLPGSPQGAWGNAPFLQVNSPKIGILGKNTPAQDILGRMSENLLDARQQTSLRDRVELKFSGVLDTEYSALSEIPTETLKCFAGFLDMYARFNSMTEHALTEYRDQLTAFDQTIQEYQDMLDGKSPFPEDMTAEQVQATLDLVKETRAQFLQDGGKEANRRLSFSHGFADDRLFNHVTSAVLGEPFENAGKGTDFWHIDPDAEDIYGEIDRALGAVDSLTQTCSRGLGAIAAELRRRSYDDSDFMYHYSQWYQPTKPRPLPSEMNALVERTLSQLREKSLAISNGSNDVDGQS